MTYWRPNWNWKSRIPCDLCCSHCLEKNLISVTFDTQSECMNVRTLLVSKQCTFVISSFFVASGLWAARFLKAIILNMWGDPSWFSEWRGYLSTLIKLLMTPYCPYLKCSKDKQQGATKCLEEVPFHRDRQGIIPRTCGACKRAERLSQRATVTI